MVISHCVPRPLLLHREFEAVVEPPCRSEQQPDPENTIFKKNVTVFYQANSRTVGYLIISLTFGRAMLANCQRMEWNYGTRTVFDRTLVQRNHFHLVHHSSHHQELNLWLSQVGGKRFICSSLGEFCDDDNFTFLYMTSSISHPLQRLWRPESQLTINLKKKRKVKIKNGISPSVICQSANPTAVLALFGVFVDPENSVKQSVT